MASGDIAVPDLSYFIEHDLRNAIQEMDENAEREAHQATTDANISSGSNILRTSTSAALNATKKKQKKNKKAPDTTHAPKKFLSPYAVFADIRRQEVKAMHPDKKISDIWREMAIEWGHMTRIEKAPFRKEFENRQRLYELANPNSSGSRKDRKDHRSRSSVFRFAPYRRNNEFEVSRIEHLPHCPIAAKKKVYEDAVLQPYTHPKQTESVGSSSKDSKSERPAGCTSCPTVYAVCDYCRGLGYTGPRILHFESDCWSKARHSKDRKHGFTYPSMPGWRVASVRHSHHLKQAPSPFPKLPAREAAVSLNTSSEGPVDLDKICDFNLSQHESVFSNVTYPIPAAEVSAYDRQSAELPDLSVVDAFLASTGMTNHDSRPFW